MARLLRDLDYLRVIQSDNLAQIIESNQQVKLDVEQSAQAEMISYLAQRYKVKEIFSNTTVYDNINTYYAKNLVEYTEVAFSISNSYIIGDRVSYQNKIYEANQPIAPSAFDSAEWDYVCDDYSLFYVTLPENEFSYYNHYVTGDIVWYENKTYTCTQNCNKIYPTNGQFWTDNGTYSISGIYPTDTNTWTAGDNRNQQIVLFLIDITLYHLHSRINPRNVPDLRKERYNGNSSSDSGGAIGWCKSVAKGNVMADLPEYAPEQGMPMRYGNAATYDTPSTNMLW
jgi:hypothetical protein